MSNPQRATFLESAGDAYFRRNAFYRSSAEWSSRDMAMFASYLTPESRLLEIGCANGTKSAKLRELSGCTASGLDPSAEAIADGRQRFPGLDLHVGTADALPFADESFDMVYFGFVLYLLDRRLLLRAYAEADRVLTSGGFLAITDFAPDYPLSRPYVHAPGVMSYKMDYAAPLKALPSYTECERFTWSHGTETFCADPDERLMSVVLHKQPSGYVTAI